MTFQLQNNELIKKKAISYSMKEQKVPKLVILNFYKKIVWKLHSVLTKSKSANSSFWIYIL